MMRKSVLAAAAAVSMLGLGSGAVAQSAAPLSLAQVRPDADMTNAGDIRGGFILPALAIIVIGVLIYVVTKNDNPSSP
jgi:hypothetical protein